jgi:hypothetical protein
MSLKLVRLAAEVEEADQFHLARLLILIRSAAGGATKSIQGITKLAKLDFLLRYPAALIRVLESQNRTKAAAKIPEEERNTIEGRMIRFRYGPWDPRYRRWIALLVSRGLASTYHMGSTVHVKLTVAGEALADDFEARSEFAELGTRAKLVSQAVGSFGAKRLMNFIYEVIPELEGKRWGEKIEL